jgi:hypothetical protein
LDRWENEIGFHGTPSRGSIGQAVSHGCVRMYEEHIEEIFSLLFTRNKKKERFGHLQIDRRKLSPQTINQAGSDPLKMAEMP